MFLHEDDPSSMEDGNMAKIMEQLTFPHSEKEPELGADELLRLDALADKLNFSFSDCEAGKRHPGPYNRCKWSYT